MKIHNFTIDENGAFQKTKEINLSQNEYGGVRIAFALPATWDGANISLEYYAKNSPQTRIRTSPLSSSGGKVFFDICPAFTAETGAVIIQLVGEKDEKILKSLLKACPDIKVTPSVNAFTTEPDSPLPPDDDGNGNTTDNPITGDCGCEPVDISEILTRLAVLENAGGAGGSNGADLSGIFAALEQKADKSDLATKADKGEIAELTAKIDSVSLGAAVCSDIIWEGTASTVREYNQTVTIPLSNFNYDKYEAFEFYFHDNVCKIQKQADNTYCCLISQYYLSGFNEELALYSLWIDVRPDKIILYNCYHIDLNQGNIGTGLDMATLYKIKGIY